MPHQLPALARLADNLLDGHLADFMRASRADSQSWDTIAKELWARTNREIDVSGVTVQAWAVRLGIEDADTPKEAVG